MEYLPDRPTPYRARVRWTEPDTGRRRSRSVSRDSPGEAEAWIEDMRRSATGGLDPDSATVTLAESGEANMTLALCGLKPKTTDPYLAGWRKRVVPTLGPSRSG